MKSKRIVGVVIGAVVVFLLFYGVLFSMGNIGISKNKVQQDARTEQQISENWEVSQSTTDNMSALLYYNDEKSDYTASIYIKRSGLSFGYFFRIGGSILEHNEEITSFSLEGYNECAYLSMNSAQVCRIEIDNGNEIKTIDIDSTKPFAIVLPKSEGAVTFYDANENVIEPFERSM